MVAFNDIEILNKKYNMFQNLWREKKYFCALSFLSTINFFIHNCSLNEDEKLVWSQKCLDCNITQDILYSIVKDLSYNVNRIEHMLSTGFNFNDHEFLLMMTIYEDIYYVCEYLKYRKIKIPNIYLEEVEREMIKLGQTDLNKNDFRSAYDTMMETQTLPITSSNWGFPSTTA